MELDPRIIEVGIEIRGQLKIYSDLQIHATGVKFANANQNTCNLKIYNLDKATQDYIVSESSQFNKNRTPKQLLIKAGRKSYGTSQIYVGNIISAIPSSPPDIGVDIKALTGNFQNGNIVSKNQPSVSTLQGISQGIASDIGLPLDFQALNGNIANYNFSGAAIKQVDLLNQLANVNAYVDNDKLIVKNSNQALVGRTRILSAESGMIDIPQPTELGIQVKYLLDNTTTLGGGLEIRSIVYPSLNGVYIIYKLSFDIATRENPFYWIAEAKRAQ